MKEKILKVLDEQMDGFITPNQSEFYDCDIHELFQAIYSLLDKGILRKRDCEGLAYEYSESYKNLLNYTKDIILSMGGNEVDIEQIIEEIKVNGYITIEEVKSHLENYYIEEKDTYWGAELCPHCSHENDFVWIEGTPRRIKCKNCGEEFLLCSLCNMDEVECSKCPY